MSKPIINNNINQILDRHSIANEIKQILTIFDNNHNNLNYKKGIYIYGSPGCGKTEFVIQLLNELNYDIIKYDAGDVRNKSLIENITSNNISKCNVLQMMKGVSKKIAIIMDEVDGMNNGDKGGITSLIKLIRQKKTKKQKMENKTMNPIICIGNYYIDKKIKELMKVCYTFELKPPNVLQMSNLLTEYIPIISPNYKEKIIQYIQGDLRKMDFVVNMYKKRPHFINEDTLQDIFLTKSFNEDSKKLTQSLINYPRSIEQHNTFMNETERTIVALLWHENIIETLNKVKKEKAIPFYIQILDNICFADYTDRITFQNQIWQFNEMSSLMKTFYNNKIYHDTFPENINKFQPSEVRFTKVLTKYSTEYNNILFIFNLCQELDMDKKDLIAFFQGLRLYYGKDFFNSQDVLNIVENIFQDYNINKLDIKRMYRYLDKNVKKDLSILEDDINDIDMDMED
jgi:DNA polymerase III delta prime subunit